MKPIRSIVAFARKNKLFCLTIIALLIATAFMCDTSAGIAVGTISVFATPIGIPINETPTVATLDDAGIAKQDISKGITQINPDRFPLDTLMREHVKNVSKTESQEIKFYQASAKPMVDTLDSSATGNGLSSASPCSSFTYIQATHNSGATKVYIKPSTPEIWRLHDTLLMRDLTVPGTAFKPQIGATGTAKYSQMFFISGKSGDVLELTPIGGLKASGDDSKSVVPDFSASQKLVRCAPAKSEKALSGEPYANYPEASIQFCQNFIVQIEESTFHALTLKEVAYGIDDMEREVLYSMRAEMENTYLFGERGLIRVGNEQTYFSGGIIRMIDKVLTYGNGGGDKTVTKEDYNSWLKSVFTGNNGSKSRILLAGSGLIMQLELLRESVKQINGLTSMSEVLGIKVVKMVSTFGELNVIHAPLFDESDWEDYGAILDLEHISKHVFVPMHARELDLKTGSTPVNATAKTIQEASCLTLRNPECHAIIMPKA